MQPCGIREIERVGDRSGDANTADKRDILVGRVSATALRPRKKRRSLSLYLSISLSFSLRRSFVRSFVRCTPQPARVKYSTALLVIELRVESAEVARHPVADKSRNCRRKRRSRSFPTC